MPDGVCFLGLDGTEPGRSTERRVNPRLDVEAQPGVGILLVRTHSFSAVGERRRYRAWFPM